MKHENLKEGKSYSIKDTSYAYYIVKVKTKRFLY